MPDFFKRMASGISLMGARENGWRAPQLGALGATMAHWSLGEREATLVSIPTGTGKTAVAMAAPFLTSNPPTRMLVLAPSRAVRDQLVRNISSYAQLQRIGVLAEEVEGPSVLEISGLVQDWDELRTHDVVVSLPNSISPVHYDDDRRPPVDLFDLLVVDEAHHSPARSWEAVLDHFASARKLLLTATPTRRDGRRIPGSLEYYYPLRRALEEGFYNPVDPVLLAPGADRAASDRIIAERAIAMLRSEEHASSVLLVRAGSIARLGQLQQIYEEIGVELELLHNSLGDTRQREVVEKLRAGEVRVVGVVGMLGEGFDLPAIRLVAYHDKHRSVPATVQLIGRLARVDAQFPQSSALITVSDADVFPELKGVLRDLYEEDADWANVLPGILDEEIARERADREFSERFPASHTEIDASHLQPIKRAILYEVPADWEPPFLADQVPDELELGAPFGGGVVAYAGADPEARLLVLVVRFIDRPKWSSDPALADIRYQLHVIAHRPPPEVGLPGVVMLNIASDGLRKRFEAILGLDEVGEPVGPERLGEYLDSLDRLSVSSVGVRSTDAATRGRATYRNYMGGDVDRGMRSVDLARSALGHVMFQLNTDSGAANAGGAIEKSKVWLSRYEPLREFSEWVDFTCGTLWYPHEARQGRLLPGVDRGRRLDAWPESRPLAAELFPGLLGMSFELLENGQRLGGIEDLELYVNDDPTETLQDIDGPTGEALSLIGVYQDRIAGTERCVWEAEVEVDGAITASRELSVRRGHGEAIALSDLLEAQPPTIYFLDGTTTIGAVRYDRRTALPTFNPEMLTVADWDGSDITAETVATALSRGMGEKSIHEHLEGLLRDRPRTGVRRWLLKNDGSGEIADYLVVEELESGEVRLALWHAKSSHGANPSVRIKDFQEVTAQALRSRRWLTSTLLWSEVAARLFEGATPPITLVEGSDSVDDLQQRLGVGAEDNGFVPWTQSRPIVRGLVGIAQPGLSSGQLTTQLAANPVPDGAEALRELFGLLTDTTVADGSELAILVSA
jgi:superfamily II DNA or RNA helicase